MRQMVVTVTNAGNSGPLPLDIHGRPEVSLQVTIVSGSPTWTVQQTLDSPYSTTPAADWFDHPDTNMVAQTVKRQGNYAYIPAATRIVVTGTGVVRFTVVQAGLDRA